MAVSDNKNCSVCGKSDNLSQCAKCDTRLSAGLRVAICSRCAADPRRAPAAGKFESASSVSPPQFVCTLCHIHAQQAAEDEMLRSVGGPSPEDVLRCVAAHAPWYLVIARATPDEKLAAHYKVKRQVDFTSSARELADSMAHDNPMAAIIMSTMGQPGASVLATKAMDAFVTAKCPTIKYKSLLLPEKGGSLDKARRHFGDLKSSPEPLVAAMAEERDFLCAYVERQCTPPTKKGARNELMQMPRPALYWLRFIFKSLSQRIKKASARQEAELLLARAWYADHMVIAHSWVHQHIVESAAAAWSPPTVRALAPVGSIESSSKRLKREPAQGAPSSSGPLADVTFLTKDNVSIQAPGLIARWVRPNMTSQQAEKLLKEYEKEPQYVVAFRKFFGLVCKNCFLAGRGFMSHKLSDCQRQGHPCVLICPKCVTGRHWTADCPKLKAQKK